MEVKLKSELGGGELAADFGKGKASLSTLPAVILMALMGLCWGVISIKWNSFSEPLSAAARTVWWVGGGLLLVISVAVQLGMKKSKATTCCCCGKTPAEKVTVETTISTPHPDKDKEQNPADNPTITTEQKEPCRCCHEKSEESNFTTLVALSMLIWLPLLIFLCLSSSYHSFLAAWNHKAETPAQKVEIVNAGADATRIAQAITNLTDAVKSFKESKNDSNMWQQLQALVSSLQNDQKKAEKANKELAARLTFIEIQLKESASLSEHIQSIRGYLATIAAATTRISTNTPAAASQSNQKQK